MTTDAPMLTARRWRSRRSAAIAGIVFAVLLLAGLTMIRIALSESSLQALETNAQRRSLIRFSLQLVPFAGIAFLWFIGVIREQLGDVEDRLFSTVFLGSGLLFLAMLFMGAVNATGLLATLAGPNPKAGLSHTVVAAPRPSSRSMPCGWRQCSHFGEHSGAPHLRAAALGLLPRLSGGADSAAGEHKWLQLLFPTWVLLVSVVILFTAPIGLSRRIRR